MKASHATNEMQANAKNRYEITENDLPLHCPMTGMGLWNSHPRVYIPITAGKESRCPYCGALYSIKASVAKSE